MGQTAAIALLNSKYLKKHTPKYFFIYYCIIALLLMSVFWEAEWQRKAVHYLDKFYIFWGGKP